MSSGSSAKEKLVAYARENPWASDTAEGIAKWWVKMPLEEVLPALESLSERGTWEKLRLDDRVLYRPVRNGELHDATCADIPGKMVGRPSDSHERGQDPRQESAAGDDSSNRSGTHAPDHEGP